MGLIRTTVRDALGLGMANCRWKKTGLKDQLNDKEDKEHAANSRLYLAECNTGADAV